MNSINQVIIGRDAIQYSVSPYFLLYNERKFLR